MSYPEKPTPENYILYEDNSEEAPPLLLDDVNSVQYDGTEAFEKPTTNNIIHTEVNLPKVERIQCAKVIGCTKDPHGYTVGKYNDNPLFNSMLYVFDFTIGKLKVI